MDVLDTVLSTRNSINLARGQSGLPRHASLPASDPDGLNRQADAYISELLSYSLDRLRKEPELLLEDRQQVERSMQSSALSHYHAFIDSANCLSVVQHQLSRACDGLDDLASSAPQLGGAFDTFSKQAASVMAQHSENKQLLVHQSTLLELLDAPQLMDTCVRNGIYDEALDLHAFIMRVSLLHPKVPVVELLASQAQAVSQAMLGQLLQRLRSNIQLPECLRVIGYLRRMAVFSEAELRLHFLRCREDWLSQLITELDDTNSYEYLKHLTDMHRLHLFDIVMQYRAVFFEGSAAQDPKAANTREGSVLYTWVQHRIEHFMAALQQHLPVIEEGANLALILEHCMYCCSSLSRVGLDFSSLLQPLFQLCMLRLFSARLAVAVDGFHQRLDHHKWVPMPSAVSIKPQRDGADAGADSAEELHPPHVLMEYAPLAVFTNGVLLALNELRHCALLPLQHPAGSMLQGALEQVASSLVHYRQTHTLADNEFVLFMATTRALSDVVVGYMAQCFGRIFQNGSAAVSVAAISRILQDIDT